LALLQAEALACAKELANVPNVRWLFLLFAGRQNKNSIKFAMSLLFLALHLTLSIRIVADCVALSCQVTRKLNRAKTLEFTTISAIIFIHCVCPA